MQIFTLSLFMFLTLSATAQEERDTVLKRCPVFITDTATANNFFIEGRPATLKVYRVKGDLTIVIEQRDQFFSLFFAGKRLKNGKYKIDTNPRGNNEVAAKYSFRTEDQVSYVSVANGTIEVIFDKEKELWLLKLNGMIANLVGTSISYYKVRADLAIK